MRPERPADLYEYPELYDALLPVDAHAPFCVDLARQQGGAVLELACGTAAFVEGDMRDFALSRRFDLIFIARNSLLHLLSAADVVAAFTAARRHLAPGGLFAFDIFNPNPALLARPRGERVPVMEVSTAAFGAVRVEASDDYDPVSQVNRSTWYVSTADTRDAWVVPLVLRSIFPEQLDSLIAAAGLELVNRFGELSGEPFGSGSRIQACLCRASA